MSETVFERVVRIVAEQSGAKASDVKPESGLVSDLGMDSLDIIETVMAVEEEFEINIPDEVCEKWATVQDVIDAADLPGA